MSITYQAQTQQSVTRSRPFASLGSVYGKRIFGQSVDYSLEETVNVPRPGKYAPPGGWKFLGETLFGKSYLFDPFEPTERDPSGVVDITITTVSGAIVGRIRTDILNTPLLRLEFTADEKGSADCIMVLNRIPDFPILERSVITINIGEEDFTWYRGIIDVAPRSGTPRDEYEYEAYGLRRMIEEETIVDQTFTAGQDIGEIVDSIVEDIIAPNTIISRNPGKIDTSTGVMNVVDLVWEEELTDAVLDNLSGMAGYRWGVDADGEFYFEKRDLDTLNKNWWSGYDFEEFRPERNTREVFNRIKVHRKREQNDSGWTIGAIENDLSSQARYGIKEKVIEVGGVFSDADCEILAKAELERLSEPRFYAELENIPIRGSDQFIRRGLHRIISTPQRYEKRVQEMDDDTDWTVTNPGSNDLSIETDSTTLVSGAASLKLDWTDANDSTIESDIDVRGIIREIRFFVISNRSGVLIQAGVGLGAAFQNTVDVSIDVTDQWFPVLWDVRDLDLTDLDEIGFRVLDSSEPTTLRLDQVEMILEGSQHYRVEFESARYIFEPEGVVVSSAEFGPRPRRLEDYTQQALAIGRQARAVGRS